ncbi:MAG: YcaQ family DNA glycosylase [Theionarchaea archaeon]|nr:YcaQ family DNA glycosylase [Theionarchaea archaeon]MBU7021333.1 YcaQ family DNA glycosylase [Theionarchaea archaeon]
MLTVTPSHARKALFHAHGFSSLQKGIPGTLAVLQKHQCIQSDPIEVAGRNADLTLQSRVSDYNQNHLYHLLYQKRDLFEYFCKMLSILPMETYPVFNWLRTRMQNRNAPFFKEHEKETELILKMLEDGPVASRDIKGWKKVQWWGSTALSRVLLERLWISGKVAIHHREGALKYYVLAEDVIPPSLYAAEPPDDEECMNQMASIIARASRLVSPSRAPEQWYGIGKTQKIRELLVHLEKEGIVFAFHLEGWKGKVYAPIEDFALWHDPPEPPTNCLRFLAPLDPLTWNRALFQGIYGTEYSWEVYKKVENRKYGYYCLPLLHNGDYVGLLDPFYRKENQTLEIRNFHLFDSVDCHIKDAVVTELQRFLEYLGGQHIEAKNGPEWLQPGC